MVAEQCRKFRLRGGGGGGGNTTYVECRADGLIFAPFGYVIIFLAGQCYHHEIFQAYLLTHGIILCFSNF